MLLAVVTFCKYNNGLFGLDLRVRIAFKQFNFFIVFIATQYYVSNKVGKFYILQIL